jgi:hypothetical protein
MGIVIRHPWRPLRAGLVLVLLAVLAAGCDLFKPATPETGGGGVALIANYAKPESCLYYMRVGIERKDPLGQTVYLGALADSLGGDGVGFHAFFDQVVWNAYQGNKPDDWNLDYETQFLPLFIQRYTAPYAMKWLPDVYHPHDVTDDPDHQILHRRYEVRAGALLIAVGYADLYFTRISTSRWALVRWEDRLDTDVGADPKDPLQRTFGYRRLNGSGG